MGGAIFAPGEPVVGTMSDQSAAYAELPRTAYLDHTLRRARSAAEQRSHRYVTLEHLLLALLDDHDAFRLLQATGADISVIRVRMSDAVNNRMASLVVPDGRAPAFSYKFDSLFAGASADAIRIGRREVDGALALIAVAREGESTAAAILAANGFAAEAGLQAIAASTKAQAREARPPVKDRPPAPKPAVPRDAAPARAAPQPQGLSYGAAARAPEPANLPPDFFGEGMEDMMASVRNILEAEERKERALQPPPLAPPTPPGPRPALPRAEPRLKANGAAAKTGPQPAPRAEPVFLEAHAPQTGFAEAAAPSFDLEKSKKPEGRAAAARPPARRKAANVAFVAKALAAIPRRTRVASPETIEILIGKEEAGLIFGWLSRQDPQQRAESEAACRAITLRLTAPEGGFFIEGIAPETQWLLDRPAFLSEETFGTWAWTAIPNDSGAFSLVVSMAAREVDAHGMTKDIVLPDQVIKVQVRGNPWRGVGRFVRRALLVLSGSGLTVAAYYALKFTGKLPHLP
jgi:neural Wiskott-Aldrich syndrome protein